MERWRIWLAAIGVAWWLASPAAALACSPAPLEVRFKDVTSSATVIAVGTVEANAHTAYLNVEEYWRGSERAPRLTIFNHSGMMTHKPCDIASNDPHELLSGMRIVAFLQPLAPGVWRLAGWDWRGYIIIDSAGPYPQLPLNTEIPLVDKEWIRRTQGIDDQRNWVYPKDVTAGKVRADLERRGVIERQLAAGADGSWAAGLALALALILGLGWRRARARRG
ncbi:MAG TPA: hypothetical protein VGE07_19200 [Herpetosiphonaceae bacterium]